MAIWRYPSDEDLRENGFLDRFEMMFKSPLKWIYLFFILFGITVYLIVEHQTNKDKNVKIEKGKSVK